MVATPTTACLAAGEEPVNLIHSFICVFVCFIAKWRRRNLRRLYFPKKRLRFPKLVRIVLLLFSLSCYFGGPGTTTGCLAGVTRGAAAAWW